MGLSMALFSVLTIKERFAVARAMLAMLRLGKNGRDKLDALPFGQWLDSHHQSPAIIKKFYDPVLISALNEESRDASAKYAIQVFQDAMLAHRKGYRVGLPNCPLGALYEKSPCSDLRLNTRVEELLFTNDRITALKLRSGETLDADAVVLATNHHAVQRWIPQSLQLSDPRFRYLDKLESVPILGVHMWFDRPVMKLPFAALIDGPLQWLFRKDAEGRALHGVISASRHWTNIPKEEALQQFTAQIRSLFKPARNAQLMRGVIVIEKRATFSPKPGADAYRPSQAPGAGIENLFLAGDYTHTHWPATMEGAVRSGYLAAEALAQTLGFDIPFLLPDLPTQWPARLLGL